MSLTKLVVSKVPVHKAAADSALSVFDRAFLEPSEGQKVVLGCVYPERVFVVGVFRENHKGAEV